jgi:hypothetical protein
MERRRLLMVVIPLAINVLISWMVLPFAIPPFGGYSLRQLLDIALWQGIGTVGWPLVLLGWLLSLPFGQVTPRLGSLLLTLMYPAMLVLLVRALTTKILRRWELALLHILLALSFALLWYQVLAGYDFMVG